MYCYRTFISVFESSIFDIGEHCIARTASVLKYFIPVSRQNSSTPVIIFEALLQEVVLSSWDNMFPDLDADVIHKSPQAIFIDESVC